MHISFASAMAPTAKEIDRDDARDYCDSEDPGETKQFLAAIRQIGNEMLQDLLDVIVPKVNYRSSTPVDKNIDPPSDNVSIDLSFSSDMEISCLIYCLQSLLFEEKEEVLDSHHVFPIKYCNEIDPLNEKKVLPYEMTNRYRNKRVRKGNGYVELPGLPEEELHYGYPRPPPLTPICY